MKKKQHKKFDKIDKKKIFICVIHLTIFYIETSFVLPILLEHYLTYM